MEELEEELTRLKLEMAKLAEKKKPPAVPTGNAVETASAIPTATPVSRGASASGAVPSGAAPAPFYPYGAQGYGAYPNPGVATPHGGGGYAGGSLNYAGYPPSGYGGAAAEGGGGFGGCRAVPALPAFLVGLFAGARAFAGPRVPGARERARNPWGGLLGHARARAWPEPVPGLPRAESFDVRALSPKGAASRGGDAPTDTENAERAGASGAGRDLSLSLAATASPRASSGGRDLGELLGLGARVGAEDVLGMYLVARSQQVARRKFLCEIDGKVFSTMNLMRVHFERHYQADAEAWWSRHRRADASS